MLGPLDEGHVIESFVVGSLMAFGASVVVALFCGWSRLSTKKYKNMRYPEIFRRLSPQAASMTLYGQAWPYAWKAVVISGFAVLVTSSVAAISWLFSSM